MFTIHYFGRKAFSRLKDRLATTRDTLGKEEAKTG
jgi:hypothetical protein